MKLIRELESATDSASRIFLKGVWALVEVQALQVLLYLLF